MNSIKKIMDPGWHPGRAALAGILATITYSIAMEGDKFLIGNRFSDVRFIEGMIEGAKQSKKGLLLAWTIHFLNGVALAELYGAAAKRWLPGPNWLKGSLFSEIFIASAWSLTPIADTYHPLIKNKEMPKLANWKSFGQNLIRHLVFGLTLGWFYQNGKR